MAGCRMGNEDPQACLSWQEMPGVCTVCTHGTLVGCI